MNKNLHQLIFPQLDDASWSHVDLNRLAQLTNPEVFQGGEALNPFLDPYFTENWLKDVIHPNLDCEYSYGGYLENRGKIWQGSYITSKASFHLGIDFNVPTGTTVHAPQDCEVVETIEDGETHGWGNRITFKLEMDYILFLDI